MKHRVGSILWGVCGVSSVLGLASCVPGGIGGAGGETPSPKLTAALADGTFSAEVNVEEVADETRFEVTIVGGQSGAVVDITLNGIVVATVTLDTNGTAHVEYSDQPDDSTGQLPLPDGFQFPQVGDPVAVGETSGAFRADNGDDDDDASDDNGNDNGDDADADANDNDASDDNGNDNGDDDGSDDADEITELKAEMTGAGFSAEVDYEVELDRIRLRIEIEDGTPGAVLTVVVSGVALQNVTVDAEGAARVEYSDRPTAGELPLPDGFPTLEMGDIAVVGGIAGMFVLDAS